MGFRNSISNTFLFTKSENGDVTILLVYVADILNIRSNEKHIEDMIKMINDSFAFKILD